MCRRMDTTNNIHTGIDKKIIECPYCLKIQEWSNSTRLVCGNCSCDFHIFPSGETEVLFFPSVYQKIYTVLFVSWGISFFAIPLFVVTKIRLGREAFFLFIFILLAIVFISIVQAIHHRVLFLPGKYVTLLKGNPVWRPFIKAHWYKCGIIGKIFYIFWTVTVGIGTIVLTFEIYKMF